MRISGTRVAWPAGPGGVRQRPCVPSQMVSCSKYLQRGCTGGSRHSTLITWSCLCDHLPDVRASGHMQTLQRAAPWHIRAPAYLDQGISLICRVRRGSAWLALSTAHKVCSRRCMQVHHQYICAAAVATDKYRVKRLALIYMATCNKPRRICLTARPPGHFASRQELGPVTQREE